MLYDYYKLHIQCVEAKDPELWKNLSISELMIKYISTEDEYYLNGLILKYWKRLTNIYYKQYDNKYLSEEDIYDTFIEVIHQVKIEQPWNNPQSSLYQDIKGPEKALAIRLKCEIINLKVAQQRDKRILSTIACSLEELTTENPEKGDLYTPKIDDTNTYISHFLIQKINEYLYKKEYVKALILDLIAFNGIMKESALANTILNLTESYFNYFILTYSVNKEELNIVIDKISLLPYNKFKRYIHGSIRELALFDLELKDIIGVQQ